MSPFLASYAEWPLIVFSRGNPSNLNTVLRYPVSGRAFRVRCIANAYPEKPGRVIKVRRSVFLATSPDLCRARLLEQRDFL
jgi:hypothetical protein